MHNSPQQPDLSQLSEKARRLLAAHDRAVGATHTSPGG